MSIADSEGFKLTLILLKLVRDSDRHFCFFCESCVRKYHALFAQRNTICSPDCLLRKYHTGFDET